MVDVVTDMLNTAISTIGHITLLLLYTAIAITLIISALVYLAIIREGSRSSSERIRERAIHEEEEASTRARRTSAILTRGDIALLKALGKVEAIPLDILKEASNESPQTLAERLMRLREQGLIDVTGGMVMLSRRGKKVMELMLEKYWYKELEKRR